MPNIVNQQLIRNCEDEIKKYIEHSKHYYSFGGHGVLQKLTQKYINTGNIRVSCSRHTVNMVCVSGDWLVSNSILYVSFNTDPTIKSYVDAFDYNDPAPLNLFLNAHRISHIRLKQGNQNIMNYYDSFCEDEFQHTIIRTDDELRILNSLKYPEIDFGEYIHLVMFEESYIEQIYEKLKQLNEVLMLDQSGIRGSFKNWFTWKKKMWRKKWMNILSLTE